MDHIPHKSPETAPNTEFGERFAAITERSLSPENIETYADDALADTVEVVSDAVATFAKTGEPLTSEIERNALVYHGLDPDMIETTLDRISAIADEIRGLDQVLETVVVHTNTVITPPDSQRIVITPSDGSFKEKEIIPRFKTVAFLLQKSFDVDLSDPDQVTITDGVLRSKMMRRESYKMIQLHERNRIILVCNEEGNATFVLDSEMLKKGGIVPETLAEMTKDDLGEYVVRNDGAGVRLIYSERFVDNIVSLVELIPKENEDIAQDETAGKLLKKIELVPDGYLSAPGIGEQFGIDREAVLRIVNRLGATLGDVHLYKFKHGAPVKAYSPKQQTIISNAFENEGLFTYVDDDYKPLSAIAMELFGSLQRRGSIHAAIKGLGEGLGEVKTGVNGRSRRALPQYSPTQQAQLKEWLQENGHLTPRPEGYAPINTMAKQFGVADNVITRAIKMIGADELGPPIKAIGDRAPTDHYSAEQQEQIYQYLEKRGNFTLTPEGYTPLATLASSHGLEAASLNRAVSVLGGELGEVLMAKSHHSAKPTQQYSPSQQHQILEWLRVNGRAKTRAKLGQKAFSAAQQSAHN